MKEKKQTPLMEQYASIKSKYSDAILLFRVGDFYETFSNDAIEVSKILGIILTKRANGSSNVELAGFPFHSLNTYLPKLVKAGKRVAICEQLEEASATKKIVKRGVTELITPGVSLNDQILDAKKNNYLASVYIDEKLNGVSFLDVSTGSFFVAEGSLDYVNKLLVDFSPTEVLIPKKLKNNINNKITSSFYFYAVDDWLFSLDFAKEELETQFNTSSLKGFGVEKLTSGLIASGVILYYLKQTQLDKLEHIINIKRIDRDDYVWMDQFTIRNLEILHSLNPHGKSLFEVLNKTFSPIGSRMLRRWLSFPLIEKEEIEKRQNIVKFLINNESSLDELSTFFKDIGDLERMVAKISISKISPRELIQFKNSIKIISSIKNISKKQKLNKPFEFLINQLDDCENIVIKIEKQVNDDAPVLLSKGGVIKEKFSQKLDEYREITLSSEKILEDIKNREVERTGISSLKISYNNVFGYYLEVRNKYKENVPQSWIRKQTLVSAERYITEELKEVESKIINAKTHIIELEGKLYDDLINSLKKSISIYLNNAKLLATIDCFLSFAIVSKTNNYIKPIITDDNKIDIKNGRHPVIEYTFSNGEQYIPNDIYLDNKSQQIIIITGPNMSGKSAILRQTALIVLMAQIGCHVPCDEAVIGLTDKIFTRVGASDNISQGESTFMVEMNESASILNNLSEKSLILLDEIGRGTSTFDGVSIAWAIAEYLHNDNFKPKTLFATHYHELNEMTDKFQRIKNYHVSVVEKNNEILFLRKLQKGGSNHSFGIHVAKMAGIPPSILNKAHEMLDWLESHRSSKKMNKTKQNMQLSFIQLDDPILEEIKQELINTDINSLTPVEALMKLNSIKEKIKPNKNNK
tara:strand:- start:28139 stop:30736 length:2598 start_codon:yes stop_codon:yes gene_type:complete